MLILAFFLMMSLPSFAWAAEQQLIRHTDYAVAEVTTYGTRVTKVPDNSDQDSLIDDLRSFSAKRASMTKYGVDLYRTTGGSGTSLRIRSGVSKLSPRGMAAVQMVISW